MRSVYCALLTALSVIQPAWGLGPVVPPASLPSQVELRSLPHSLPQTLPMRKPSLEPLTNTTDSLIHPLTQTVDEGVSTVNNLVATVIRDVKGKERYQLVPTETGFLAVDQEWLLGFDLTIQGAQKRDNTRLLLGDTGLEGTELEILSQTHYPSLALMIVRVKAPANLDNREALQQLLQNMQGASVIQFDRNYVYQAQQQPLNVPTPENQPKPLSHASTSCSVPVRIGMVDGQIATDHPAFANQQIIQHGFTDEDIPTPQNHGTAVAGIMIGQLPDRITLLPQAQLYNGQVLFTVGNYQQGAILNQILASLAWLAEQPIQVTNMSLSGPDHPLLALAIAALQRQKITVVAAAGNRGPAAPPQFPAAYPDVIAVTAVDHQGAIYRWANQGDYVDYAALGVSVLTSQVAGKFGRETGTSMAAPRLSARIGCLLAQGLAVKSGLHSGLTDAGKPGRDPVFGEGIVW